MSWRTTTDWAKRNPTTLRIADRLGRGRGRLRLLDRLKTAPPPRLKPDLSRWNNVEAAAAWLGHASVLFRLAGKTIVTDPVLSTRVGIGLGIMTGGPARLIAPALSLAELPTVDVVLLSHAHFDHLDRPTLSRLNKSATVVTAAGTGDLVSDLGFIQVTELRWGESTVVDGVSITAKPVRHWGARTFYDQHRGFNAYLLEGGGRRVLYGGDSAYQEFFRELPAVDLAVLGIGAYDPYLAAHATPEQALQMADHCRAERILPMHHSTFRLSHEPMEEPIERMLAAVGANAERVVVKEVGGQVEF